MILAANVMSRSQNEGFKVTGKRAARWLSIYSSGQLPSPLWALRWLCCDQEESRDHMSSAHWENLVFQAEIGHPYGKKLFLIESKQLIPLNAICISIGGIEVKPLF